MRLREPHPVRYDATGAQQLRPFPGTASWIRDNLWIFMGTVRGVRQARQRKGAGICPIDIDPFAFRWPVQGLFGVLVRVDEDRRELALRLVQAMLRDGAEMVCVLSDDAKTTFHYAAHRSGLNNDEEMTLDS
jgi:hypothetical protein